MNIFDFLTMLGGLALFLYGMNAMGEGLLIFAGETMKNLLWKFTSKRITAVLLGTAVTAIIQSSSAVTVIVVGLVNSGIMNLSQAIGVIMGANIGTTVTSWLFTFVGIESDYFLITLLNPTSFSSIVAIIGVLFILFSKSQKKKSLGTIFAGFAILMYGMETMSSAVSGLSENENFTNILIRFDNPVLCVVAGAVFTAIIQSSSASVGILQALATTGILTYKMALPVIMGQNIGTCITAILAGVGAGKNAKRASFIHLYFNLVGTVLCMITFYPLNRIFHFEFMNCYIGTAGIAVIHSLFNLIVTIMLYPFADDIVKMAKRTIK